MKATTIDIFTRAYIEAMLWAETDHSDESGGEPLENNYGIEDIATETLLAIVEDCKQFQEENRAAIKAYPAQKHCGDNQEYSGDELAGHDYWLTRNGHGTGFWDRDFIPQWAKDELTSAASRAGEVWVYVSDDELIHITS